jgi:hypothetical protein
VYLLLLFKTHLSEIFLFQLAWPKEPTWALDLPSKIFSILLLNSLRCSYLRWFHVFCENTQIHSAYAQYTYSFILHIFHIVYVKFHSAYSENMHCKNLFEDLCNSSHSTLFHVFQHGCSFIPHLLYIRQISRRMRPKEKIIELFPSGAWVGLQREIVSKGNDGLRQPRELVWRKKCFCIFWF